MRETLGMIPVEKELTFSLAMWAQTRMNRAFELRLAEFYDLGNIKFPIYLSIGQEHIPAAIATVSHNFKIFAQHRCHSYYLSFGGYPADLLNMIMGGPQGSASVNMPGVMFGHSGLMGDQAPIGVGYAMATGNRTLVVLGDASIEEDYVFGAMGYAVTHKLPVLFVCEDNDRSILTPVATRRSWSMVDVTNSLGMASVDITDDPWLIAYHIERLLGQLPALINVRTCRHRWHNGTGSDGEPEWDRYAMIKKEMECLRLRIR